MLKYRPLRKILTFVRCIETILVFRFIVDKIDKNKDGEVTEEELREWIQYVQKRYITTDTDRMWKDHTVEGDTLTWESYKIKNDPH
jgi:Ca2+-binding EF-hand superfamily protein